MDSNTCFLKEKEIQEEIIRALLLCSSYKNESLLEISCKYIDILKKYQEENKEILETLDEKKLKARKLRDEIIDMLQKYIKFDPNISFSDIRLKISELDDIEGKRVEIDDRDASKDIRRFSERELREIRSFSNDDYANNSGIKRNIQ